MPITELNPTRRFSDRVANYVRYRPGYPAEIPDLLRREIGFDSSWRIADVGSGTGISAELFLKRGNPVTGIEPNAEMRQAGEEYLRPYARFRSLDGTAERMPLPDASIDLIVAAQAFHWFDLARSRPEFTRVLASQGGVLLLWNSRLVHSSPFLIAYENLLREFATDYERVDHKRLNESLLQEFLGNDYRKWILPNRQEFNLEGLIGRLLSSSYVPLADDPRHAPMLARAAAIFAEHAQNGSVAFEYESEVRFGRL